MASCCAIGRNSDDATNASLIRRAFAEGLLCLRAAVLLRAFSDFADRARVVFVPLLCAVEAAVPWPDDDALRAGDEVLCESDEALGDAFVEV